MRSLLPSSYLDKEHAADRFLGSRFSLMRDISGAVEKAVDPMRCQEQWLVVLAKKRTADFWDTALKEDDKRRIVVSAIRVKPIKGTAASIRMVLESLGEDGRIDEGLYVSHRDGYVTYDGIYIHGHGAWWKYVLRLTTPATIERAATIKRTIQRFHPARCELKAIIFDALITRDGTINYDAIYTHGTIGVQNG